MQWNSLPAGGEYTTFARFRVTTDTLTTSDAGGLSSDGEAEDYQVTFNFPPTTVTIGSVELNATTVAGFLGGLNIEQMDKATLLSMLNAWDTETAENLSGAGRTAILNALRNYLDPDGDGQLAVLYWDTLEERGTTGFYVERKQDDSYRIRINFDLLPGLIAAPMGGEYQLADPSAQAGESY